MKCLMNTIGSVLTLLVLLLIFTACQPQEQELSFETISQDVGFWTGRSYGGEEPNLLIIAGPKEVDTPGWDIQFPAELADQLRTLDYSRVFAILVLQGLQGSTGYNATVRQVTRQGNQVAVKAEFVTPAPETFIMPAFTSPYHLIAVSKAGAWGEPVRFVLVVNDKVVAETTHVIP